MEAVDILSAGDRAEGKRRRQPDVPVYIMGPVRRVYFLGSNVVLSISVCLCLSVLLSRNFCICTCLCASILSLRVSVSAVRVYLLLSPLSQSMSLPLCLSVFLPRCPSIRVSVCVCLSTCLFVSLSLSVYIFITVSYSNRPVSLVISGCTSISLCTCPPVARSVCLCLYVFVSAEQPLTCQVCKSVYDAPFLPISPPLVPTHLRRSAQGRLHQRLLLSIGRLRTALYGLRRQDASTTRRWMRFQAENTWRGSWVVYYSFTPVGL